MTKFEIAVMEKHILDLSNPITTQQAEVYCEELLQQLGEYGFNTLTPIMYCMQDRINDTNVRTSSISTFMKWTNIIIEYNSAHGKDLYGRYTT